MRPILRSPRLRWSAKRSQRRIQYSSARKNLAHVLAWALETMRGPEMNTTRRGFWRFLPAALLARWASAAEPAALPSQWLPFAALPLRSSNGAQIRQIVKGKTATGEVVEVH